MYPFYKKNELNFSLILIMAYVVSLSLADSLSASLGILKIITAPICILFTVFLLYFIKKLNLWEYYGLCSFQGKLSDYLYFIPLIFILSVNLWNGIAWNTSILETVLFTISMLGVGFIEEIIFRGFLFKALCKDNIKLAIFISSITFGMGHIINLLNGKTLISTLLQICYATAIGFLITILCYKDKSLWPCIFTHGIVNSLSILSVNHSSFIRSVITTALLSIIALAYALWIIKKTEKFDDENRDRL